jgi:hypothetical protein
MQLSGLGVSKKRQLSTSRQGCGVSGGRSMWGQIHDPLVQWIHPLAGAVHSFFRPLLGTSTLLIISIHTKTTKTPKLFAP